MTIEHSHASGRPGREAVPDRGAGVLEHRGPAAGAGGSGRSGTEVPDGRRSSGCADDVAPGRVELPVVVRQDGDQQYGHELPDEQHADAHDVPQQRRPAESGPDQHGRHRDQDGGEREHDDQWCAEQRHVTSAPSPRPAAPSGRTFEDRLGGCDDAERSP
jgi:hypothetical protein